MEQKSRNLEPLISKLALEFAKSGGSGEFSLKLCSHDFYLLARELSLGVDYLKDTEAGMVKGFLVTFSVPTEAGKVTVYDMERF
jgi:hypothetical protein